jgi:D-alanyl-D-alanine carboxypeptidase/D-alanyl-D-alanine-endopeptidase (penicillin-binding protein 4)
VVAAQTGALVVDLSSGDVVFARNPGKPFQPASNEKLATGLTALHELGGDYRISTVVLGTGDRRGSRWDGDLVLRGHGDPELGHGDLDALAGELRKRGIRRVSGRVIGDESYFDRRRTAPGWKPSFYKVECPPLSALVVDRAWLDGRTWDEPALAAAVAFKRALERAGIRVSRKAAVGRAPASAIELARVASPPVRRLVKVMETESDNFYAELLLKLLGAEEAGRGTTAAGAAVVRRELVERGVPMAGVRIVDGSGLSRLDRVTGRMLASLLVSARDDPAVSKAFVASLAVAGVSGTLEDRLTRPPARGRVRAKTGTTSAASALSGYAGGAYVFALVMNGNPVDTDAARTAQDRVARLLAAQ